MTTKKNEIFDLQGTTADFLQEAAQWQLTGTLTSATTSTCLGTYVLGGFQTISSSATFQRTYTITKPHNSVFIIFEAWMMGKWYPADQATFKVKNTSTTFSSQPFVTITSGAVDFIYGGKCTSNPDSDFSKREIFVSSPHQGSSLTLLIQSSVTASSRTFGIRNVRILISDAVVATPKQCIDVSLATVSNDCACPVGQRKNGLICVNCDLSCQGCFGGTSSGCYSCSSNYYYDGANCQICSTGCATCDGGAATDCLTCEANYFMYPSGACKSSCNSPYTSGTVGGIQHCYLPCGTTGKYYYADGNCRAACDSPFTSSTDANGAKFCYNPCTSGQHYFPDGICRSTCASPFTSTTTYGAKFCNYPCSSGHSYYNDGICRSTCDSPFQALTDSTGAKFCNNPCGSGQYYFPDGICRSACNLPFTSTTTYGAKFCNYPCGTTGKYYYEDGNCRAACEIPFTSSTDAIGAKFCHYPCETQEYLYPDGITCQTTQCPELLEVKNYFNSIQYQYCECVSPNLLLTNGSCIEPVIPPEPEIDETIKKLGNVGNVTGVINSVGLAVAAAALPGDPGGVSAGALTRIIQYSKFLNISYPDKLVMMFKAYNPASGIVSFVPKMSQEQKSKFRDEVVPYNFMAYGVHSCFIVNFWNFMLFLLILFGVCGGCLILEKLSKEIGVWARKARVILQNFWIVQLYNSSGDVMLFSIVQFRDNHWNSGEATLNFLIAIFFLLVVIIVLGLHLRTLLEYQRIRKVSSDLKSFEKNYECQEIFFGNFTDSTMNQQLFLFYFVLRVMLINLIIAVLTEYPMIQTILMVAISLILVIFIVVKRPFRSKIDLAQNLSYEAVLLTVNIALLSFATLDGNNEEKIDTRNSLAEVIIVCSVIFTFLPLIFMVLKVIVLGLQFYKEYQHKQGQKETVKGKLDFVQRVEELRVTRRTEGLRIKQPRENQFIAQNIEDSGIQLDLNNSSFITDNNNKKMGNEQFLDSSPTLYPLNHHNMTESNLHNQSMQRRNQITRNNNPHQLSPGLPLNLSTSVYPLNSGKNKRTIIDPYWDSTLDMTLPETHYNENTMEREIEFIPNRSPKRVGKGRNQSDLMRHPFQQEIKNHVNDSEGMIENIMARNRRVSERIKKRMHGSSRKVSDIS